MTTLLFNLTRFGDLLQTQPVLDGLAAAGRPASLVCLDAFAPALPLLRGVDRALPLPGAALLARMDRDWRLAAAELWRWTGELAALAPRRLLNLTATTGVRLLARCVAARLAETGRAPLPAPPGPGVRAGGTSAAGSGSDIGGFGVDGLGFGTTSNPWSAFLLASTNHRGCSPFNLVDQFCRVADLPPAAGRFELRAPDEGARAAAAALLRAEAARAGAGPEPAGFLGVQLGASDDRRRWPVGHFARLAELLHAATGLVPVLLGSKAEAGLGERFCAACAAPCVDLIGRTSLPELAAVLTRVRLLATNDTGTMHLAAGLGVDVVAVFLATAQPWDTGPYRAGSLCLEPDMDCHPCPFGAPCPHANACRTAVTPETVFELARARLATGAWAADAESTGAESTGEHLGSYARRGARVWETRVQEHGYLGLVSLSGHEDTPRTRWIRAQREVYRRFLDAGFPAQGDATDGAAPGGDAAAPAAPLPESLALAAGESLGRAELLLTLLCEQGRVLAATAAEPTKRKFLATWQRLQTLWESDRLFNVLGHLWNSQSQEAARDLASVLALAEEYLALVRFWAALLRR